MLLHTIKMRTCVSLHSFKSSLSTMSSHATSSKSYDSNKYCLDLVKNRDHENYLAGLLLPQKYRNAFFAVRAFNVEIAQLKDQVSRNTFHAGKIRFQFWRDILNNIYKDSNSSQQHPAANALERAIKEHNLTLRWFERTLDARYKDLSGELLLSMDDLETYAECGHSSILYLILEILGVQDKNAEYAASHVGVGSGIVTTLRAFPYHSSKGYCYLPSETMHKHNMKINVALKGPQSPEEHQILQNVTHDVAMQAAAHLSRARQICREGLPDLAVYSLYPALSASNYLEVLKDYGYDPFVAANSGNSQLLKLQYQMMKTKFTNLI